MPHLNTAALSRALVIKLRHHGDVLLSAPVLTTLKHAVPQCEVDALVYADTAPMLEGHPALAQLHCIDRKWKNAGLKARAQAEWELLQHLRARRYDLVVHLTGHSRGGWLTRLLQPRWSVAPQRDGRFWHGSFSHFYPRANHPRRHTVESHLDALRRLGIRPGVGDKAVQLVAGGAAEQRVDALLHSHELAPLSYLHIHAPSRWRFKCWPAEHFAELCADLSARGWPLVFTASPDEAEKNLVATILSLTRELGTPPQAMIDLSGQLSLKELAALTARSRLFIGVDSAPMHMAAAMGTPVVALFGPSGDVEWGPWQVASRVVSADFPCRPCGLDGCGGSKISDCLASLPAARVLAACEELLALPR